MGEIVDKFLIQRKTLSIYGKIAKFARNNLNCRTIVHNNLLDDIKLTDKKAALKSRTSTIP